MNKTYPSIALKAILIVILPFSIFLSSCGDDDDKDKVMCEATPVEEMNDKKNECVTYLPSTAENTITGSWSEANEKDLYTDEIVIPSDLGGGFVKVTLTHSDPDLKAAMVIDTDFQGGAIISGSAATTNNEQVREAYFSVHPNIKYSIQVSPFFNASTYPVDYTLEWEFFSRVDCWESNDVIEQGKEVLLGDTNEAYAIAGYIGDAVGALDDNTYDWYKVNIDTSSRIKVEILDLPKDMRISTRFFELNKPSQVSANFEFTGSDFGLSFNKGMTSTNTTTREMEPGTYYIEVHGDFVNSRKANNDTEDLPEHFNKTYKMSVSTL